MAATCRLMTIRN